MSLTQSRGYHHADRWTGVAASVAEYLEDYPNRTSEVEFPRGAFRAAEQFLDGVEYGISIDKKDHDYPTAHLEIPAPMFGVSCLSIAYKIFESLNPSFKGINNLERKVGTLKRQIIKVQQGHDLEKEEGLELFNFFEELMKHGITCGYTRDLLAQRFGSDE